MMKKIRKAFTHLMLVAASVANLPAQATLTFQIMRTSDTTGVLSGSGTNGLIRPYHDNEHLFTLDGNPFTIAPSLSSNQDLFGGSTMLVGNVPVNFAYDAGASVTLGLSGDPVIYFGNYPGLLFSTGDAVTGSLNLNLAAGTTFGPVGTSGSVLWGVYPNNRAQTVGTWEIVSQLSTLAPPSISVLARLADDVYNKLGGGDVGVPGVYTPALINAVPSILLPPNFGTAGSTPQLLIQPKPGVFEGIDGFKANVYQDLTSGQIVISVRGTNLGDGALYNLIADASFDPGGVANQLLVSYVNQLTDLVKQVHDSVPSSAITLTGHSMGGAVAQIVGKVAGIAVTSFDAPGAKDTLAAVLNKVPELASLANLDILSPSHDITNYRLSGDQVSLVGKLALGLGDAQLGSTVSVKNPGSPITLGWGDILNNHDMTTLANEIAANCPTSIAGQSGCISGYTGENNSIGLIIKSSTAICNAVLNPIPLSVQSLANSSLSCGKFLFPVLANVAAWIDPPPGNFYQLKSDSESPYVKTINLPILTNVAGWSLQYHDQSGWSPYSVLMGGGDFQFVTDVDALSFIPLDASGKPTYNTDYFAYGLTYATDGIASATQATHESVPEPGTLLLFAAAGLALIVVQRRRQSMYH